MNLNIIRYFTFYFLKIIFKIKGVFYTCNTSQFEQAHTVAAISENTDLWFTTTGN